MVEANVDRSRMNNFGLLRLFAASQVVFVHGFHYLKLPTPEWVSFYKAFPGVPIFFVISGFLISGSWNKSPNTRDYIIKRVGRIYPGLWACLLATVICVGILRFDIANFRTLVWLAMQSIGVMFTPQNLRGFGIGSYNSSLWTIPVELQFYILLPIVFFVGKSLKRTTWLLAIVLVLATACAAYTAAYLPGLDEPQTSIQKLVLHSFIPYFYMFMIGVLIRRFALHEHPIFKGKSIFWIILTILCTFALPNWPIVATLNKFVLGAAVISTAYTLPHLSPKLIGEFDISYGIYIYHGLIINILVQLGYAGSWNGFAFLIGSTILISCLSWMYIERPALAFAHRRQQVGRIRA